MISLTREDSLDSKLGSDREAYLSLPAYVILIALVSNLNVSGYSFLILDLVMPFLLD